MPKTIEELNADLDVAIEDGDTAAMEEISEQINAVMEGKPPAVETPESDVDDPASTGDSSASSGAGEENEDAGDDGEGDRTDQGNEDAGDDDEGQPEGILSKDGKRVFPYSVLEEARKEIGELKQQLEERDGEQQVDPEILSEVDKLRRLTAAYEQQIKAHDLEPVKLPEELQFTEEQLAQLKEFGDLGEFAAQLARQVDWMKGQITSNQQQIDQAREEPPADIEIVQGDPDLRRWAQSDYAWNKLVAIDDYVKTLPQFAGKSLAERKDEVVRLTKIELGEAPRESPPPPAKEKSGKSADDIVAGAQAHPSSLSEMGGASGRQEASFLEQTDGKSEIEIAQLMQQRLDRGESIDDLL